MTDLSGMSDETLPSRGARFLDPQGLDLQVDHQVTVGRLAGILASATSPVQGEQFFLEGVLNADDMEDHGELLVWEELHPVGEGRFELDLGDLQDALRHMLSTSSDLDAHVRLRVGSNRESLPPLSLHVTRFDLALERDPQDDAVVLKLLDTGELPALDRFRLEPVCLWDPDRADEAPLAPCGKAGRWSFAAERRAGGPWLILGWEGDWCRARPLLWTLPSRQDSAPLDELQQAIFQPDERPSCATVEEVFERLAGDPGAPEWGPVLACVQRLEHLPPAALPVTVELARSPAAAATALVAAGDDLARTWTLLEELPFGWWQVPVRTWVRTSRAWRNSLRTARSGDMLREFLAAATAQGRFLEPVGEWIRVEVLGESLRRTQLGMGLEIPLHVLEQERQALFHRTPERWWPQGDRCVRWLKDHAARLAGGLTPLKQVTLGVSRFKRPVLAAPVVAALSAALDLPVDRPTFYQLRRLRDFDREWFDTAHMLVLRIAVVVLTDEDPDILR